jgi:RND family efflux transporter MFP subunit
MKTLNLKKIIGLIVLVLIVVFAVRAVKKAKQNDANTLVAKQYPVVVASVSPTLQEVSLTLPYLAQVENNKDVNLASKISSRVKFIQASGTKVKKGDVIAELDDTSLATGTASIDAQIKAQRTLLKSLQATHKRTLELLAMQGASVEQSQKEETSIAAAQSKIETLKQNKANVVNNLTYAKILSPVDGVISKTLVNVGDMCLPGHPVAKLSATQGFYLLLRVPTDLTVMAVNFNGKKFATHALNSTFNGLAEYKVFLDDEIKLTSGDRVEVNVVVFDGQAYQLPFDALLNRDGKTFVLYQQNDKVQSMPIHVLESGEQGVVTTDKNLAGKTLLVAKGDILLRILSGAAIKILNKE